MKKFLCALLSALLIFTSIVIPVGAVENEETEIFEYGYVDSTTIGITGYNGTEENVVIPSEIDGYIVSAIAQNAFDSEDIIKSVTIPETVNYVATKAFNEVSTLEKVEFLSSGKRDLRIYGQAFNNCTLLSEIILPDERIYSVHEDSFYGSAYVNNSDNWENGVLYLGKILLHIDEENIPDTYKIKDGTTVIADSVFVDYNEEIIEINISFPDSIAVIGSLNWTTISEINENLERIGTFGDLKGFEFTIEKIVEYEKYIAQVRETGYVKTEDLHIEYIENGWLLAAVPMSYITGGLVTDEMYIIPEGVRRMVDSLNLIVYDFPGVLISMNYSESVILPESFEVLPLNNPMCANIYNVLSGVCSTVTFLNKDTEIFDDPDTIAMNISTICGYSGSTAEAYAKKYDRTFVDITNCTHEVTAIRGYIEPTCEKTGYSGDTYCAYCAELLSVGTNTESHNFDYHYEGGNECDNTYEVRECVICGYSDKVVIEQALGHDDEDFDGHCDYCGSFSDRARACSCKACKYHKSEMNLIQELFMSIQLFFWRLFRIKEVCDCGITHWNR